MMLLKKIKIYFYLAALFFILNSAFVACTCSGGGSSVETDDASSDASSVESYIVSDIITRHVIDGITGVIMVDLTNSTETRTIGFELTGVADSLSLSTGSIAFELSPQSNYLLEIQGFVSPEDYEGIQLLSYDTENPDEKETFVVGRKINVDNLQQELTEINLLSLSWDANADADGYVVYYGTDSSIDISDVSTYDKRLETGSGVFALSERIEFTAVDTTYYITVVPTFEDEIIPFLTTFTIQITLPALQVVSAPFTLTDHDAFPTNYMILWGDESGGGGGGVAGYLNDSVDSSVVGDSGGGNGGGDDDVLTGTASTDIIFGDGSGGGNGGSSILRHESRSTAFNSSSWSNEAGSSGSGNDQIRADAGDDLIFGDGFEGSTVAFQSLSPGKGGFGGGGSGGGGLSAFTTVTLHKKYHDVAGILAGKGGYVTFDGSTFSAHPGETSLTGTASGGSQASAAVSFNKLRGGGGGAGVGDTGNGANAKVSGSYAVGTFNVNNTTGGDGSTDKVTYTNNTSAFITGIVENIDFDGSGDDSRVWGNSRQTQGSGDDIIHGGQGNDVLIGGQGADTFVIDFSVEDDNAVERILDWGHGTADKLQIIDKDGTALTDASSFGSSYYFGNSETLTEQSWVSGSDEFGSYLEVRILNVTDNGSGSVYVRLYDHHDGTSGSALALTPANLASSTDVFGF